MTLINYILLVSTGFFLGVLVSMVFGEAKKQADKKQQHCCNNQE